MSDLTPVEQTILNHFHAPDDRHGSWWINPGEMAAAVEAQIREQIAKETPMYGRSMTHTWKPGEPVEYVSRKGPYGPEEVRPGTVVMVESYLMRHERLIIKFDDGEQRAINPDVMRHRSKKKETP